MPWASVVSQFIRVSLVTAKFSVSLAPFPDHEFVTTHFFSGAGAGVDVVAGFEVAAGALFVVAAGACVGASFVAAVDPHPTNKITSPMDNK